MKQDFDKISSCIAYAKGNETDLKLFQFYQNQGVYMGPCCFEGFKNGKPRSKDVFNAFAARENLKEASNYYYTLTSVMPSEDNKLHEQVSWAGNYYNREISNIEAIKQGYFDMPPMNMTIATKNIPEKDRIMLHGTMFDNKDEIGHFDIKNYNKYYRKDSGQDYWVSGNSHFGEDSTAVCDFTNGSFREMFRSRNDVATRLVRLVKCTP